MANMEFPADRIPRNQRTLHVILTELKNVRRSSRDLLKGSSFQIGTEKGETPLMFLSVTLVVNLHPRLTDYERMMAKSLIHTYMEAQIHIPNTDRNSFQISKKLTFT